MNIIEKSAELTPKPKPLLSVKTASPIDPEFLRKIRERGDKIRQETFQKHGLLDICVPAIRELRGEVPE